MAIKEILNANELDNMLTRLAFQSIEKTPDLNLVKFVGIKRRGAILADRIASKIKEFKGVDIEVGYLDITLYRDDLTEISEYPQLLGTEINFNIKNKSIILIDDVIFTGRTVRAAMDAIIDLGRPKKIVFSALIDRGHRELPIQPDFTGKFVPTSLGEKINVNLKEIDGVDSITIENLKSK